MDSFQSDSIASMFPTEWPTPITKLVLNYMKPGFALIAVTDGRPECVELWDLYEQRCVSDNVIQNIETDVGELRSNSIIYAAVMSNNVIRRWFCIMLYEMCTIGDDLLLTLTPEKDFSLVLQRVGCSDTICAKPPASLQKRTHSMRFQLADPTHRCIVWIHLFEQSETHLITFVDDQANVLWYIPGGYNSYYTHLCTEYVSYDNNHAIVILSFPQHLKSVTFDGADIRDTKVVENDRDLFYRIDVSVMRSIITHTDRIIQFERARRPLRGDGSNLFVQLTENGSFILYDVASEIYEEHLMPEVYINPRQGLFFHDTLILQHLPVVLDSTRIISTDRLIFTFRCVPTRARAFFLWTRGSPLCHLDRIVPSFNPVQPRTKKYPDYQRYKEIVGYYSPP